MKKAQQDAVYAHFKRHQSNHEKGFTVWNCIEVMEEVRGLAPEQ